jgi:hypothetical protein
MLETEGGGADWREELTGRHEAWWARGGDSGIGGVVLVHLLCAVELQLHARPRGLRLNHVQHALQLRHVAQLKLVSFKCKGN